MTSIVCVVCIVCVGTSATFAWCGLRFAEFDIVGGVFRLCDCGLGLFGCVIAVQLGRRLEPGLELGLGCWATWATGSGRLRLQLGGRLELSLV